MARVIDVATYILHKSGPLSAMKLQKLCYYAQAWHLVFDAEPLFEAKIEAWANGPVVRELYRVHRGQWVIAEGDLGGDRAKLTGSEMGTIEAVLDAYGEMTAHQLSELTHSEQPWIEARANTQPGQRSQVEISLVTMQEFYEQKTHSKG